MQKFILALHLILLSVIIIQAQDLPEGYIRFEDSHLHITGILPEEYYPREFGGNAPHWIVDASIPRILLIQRDFSDVDGFWNLWLNRYEFSEIPPIVDEIVTDDFVWTQHYLDFEEDGEEIAMTIAVAEYDGSTLSVMLQSDKESHAQIREDHFFIVLESIELRDNTRLDSQNLTAYLSENVAFRSGDITLSGTLTMPDGVGEYPVVVLISGSGPSDRNESLVPLAEIEPFRLIAEHLARNGIGVLRYDDRGVGESEGDYHSALVSDFIADANAAVEYLTTRSDVDTSAIGILGHSEGGMFAPEIANQNDSVSYVVTLAAPVVSVYDFVVQQNIRIYSAAGFAEEEYAPFIDLSAQVWESAGEGDEASLRQAMTELLTMQLGSAPDSAMVDSQVAEYLRPFYRDYVSYTAAAEWVNVDVPVLALYGTLDVQADAEQNATALEDALSHNDDVSIVTIDGANHLFQLAQTGLPDEYATLEQTIMPELLDILTEWLIEQTASTD